MALKLWIVLLIVGVTFTLPTPQYDDYGDSNEETTAKATTAKPKPTTAKPNPTTAKPTSATTAKPTSSGKKVKFTYKKSPVAGYKYTTVFGLHIFVNATAVSDAKFQHVCGVMAAFLDNDQDGCVDIPAILPKLIKEKMGHVIRGDKYPATWREPFHKLGYEFKAPQDAWEVKPKCSGTKGTNDCSDATLEEVFHVVSKGYDLAIPAVFGTEKASTLTNLLDVARGGKYLSVPTKYPAKAWYTYYDKTCRYDCQAMEYFWMSMAAYTDMIQGRSDIKVEYKFINKAAIIKGDPNMVKLLTTKKYKLPTVAPTGVYAGKTTCASGANIF